MWNLTEKVGKKINGFNSTMVSMITGNTSTEEAVVASYSFSAIRDTSEASAMGGSHPKTR